MMEVVVCNDVNHGMALLSPESPSMGTDFDEKTSPKSDKLHQEVVDCIESVGELLEKEEQQHQGYKLPTNITSTPKLAEWEMFDEETETQTEYDPLYQGTVNYLVREKALRNSTRTVTTIATSTEASGEHDKEVFLLCEKVKTSGKLRLPNSNRRKIDDYNRDGYSTDSSSSCDCSRCAAGLEHFHMSMDDRSGFSNKVRLEGLVTQDSFIEPIAAEEETEDFFGIIEVLDERQRTRSNTFDDDAFDDDDVGNDDDECTKKSSASSATGVRERSLKNANSSLSNDSIRSFFSSKSSRSIVSSRSIPAAPRTATTTSVARPGLGGMSMSLRSLSEVVERSWSDTMSKLRPVDSNDNVTLREEEEEQEMDQTHELQQQLAIQFNNSLFGWAIPDEKIDLETITDVLTLDAIIQLQAHIRGNQTRRRCRQRVLYNDFFTQCQLYEHRESAIIVIQACVRSYLVRCSRRRNNSLDEQGQQEQHDLSPLVDIMGIIKIQASIRGYLSRKRHHRLSFLFFDYLEHRSSLISNSNLHDDRAKQEEGLGPIAEGEEVDDEYNTSNNAGDRNTNIAVANNNFWLDISSRGANIMNISRRGTFGFKSCFRNFGSMDSIESEKSDGDCHTLHVTRIQSMIRGCIIRNRYQRHRQAAIAVQCFWRASRQKLLYSSLRSVSSLTNL